MEPPPIAGRRGWVAKSRGGFSYLHSHEKSASGLGNVSIHSLCSQLKCGFLWWGSSAVVTVVTARKRCSVIARPTITTSPTK